MKKEEEMKTVLVYRGNGVTSQFQVAKTTEDTDVVVSEEDEEEDPLYAAIVNHVVRCAKKS
jgi:hypothetical protein